MQNNRRQFYVFDLQLAARKVGATIPTMNELVPVFQHMKNTGRTHAIRTNTATMLIGDMELDAANNYMVLLGGVDKFEPVSGGGDMDHAEEAVGQLIVSGGDGTVDLEVAEHTLDAVALLVKRPVMLDLHAAV